MTTIDEQVKEKLAALRAVYFAELPNKVADIAVCFERWERTQDAKLLHDFYRMAHSLAGSGALYEAVDLGHKAKELELLVKSAATNRTALTAHEIAQGRAFLAELASMATALKEQRV